MSKKHREADVIAGLIRTIAVKHEQPQHGGKELRVRFWLADDAKPYTYFFGQARGSVPDSHMYGCFNRWLRHERSRRALPLIENGRS